MAENEKRVGIRIDVQGADKAARDIDRVTKAVDAAYDKAANKHSSMFGGNGSSALPLDAQREARQYVEAYRSRMAEIRTLRSTGMIDQLAVKAEGAKAAQALSEGLNSVLQRGTQQGWLSGAAQREIANMMRPFDQAAINQDRFRAALESLRTQYAATMRDIRQQSVARGLTGDQLDALEQQGRQAKQALINGLAQAGGSVRAADALIADLDRTLEQRLGRAKLAGSAGSPPREVARMRLEAFQQHNASVRNLLGEFSGMGLIDHPEVLHRFNSALKDTTAVSRQASFTMHDLRGKIFDFLGVAAGVGFVAMVFQQMARSIGAVAEAAREVTRMEGIQHGFQELSERFNENANTFLPQLREALRGTVDDMELMRIANRGMALEAVDSADSLVELMRAARILGRTQGLDATQGVNFLTEALGRGSSLRYDNIGLVYTAADAERDYAAQLGKTRDALTEYERRRAFAVMGAQKAIAVANEIGDAHATSAEDVVTLAVAFKNLRDNLLQEAFAGQTAELIAQMGRSADDTTPKLERLAGAFLKILDAELALLGRAGGGLMKFLDSQSGFSEFIMGAAGRINPDPNWDEQGRYRLPPNVVGNPSARARTESDEEALQRLQSRVKTLVSLYSELTAKGKDVSGVTGELSAAHLELRDRLGSLGDTTSDVRAGYEELETTVRDALNNVPFEEFKRRAELAMQTFQLGGQYTGDFSQGADRLTESLARVVRLLGSTGALTEENALAAMQLREGLTQALVNAPLEEFSQQAQAIQTMLDVMTQGGAPMPTIRALQEDLRAVTDELLLFRAEYGHLMDDRTRAEVAQRVHAQDRAANNAPAEVLNARLQRAQSLYRSNIALQLDSNAAGQELTNIYYQALELLRKHGFAADELGQKLREVAAAAKGALDNDPRLEMEWEMADEILRIRSGDFAARRQALDREYEQRRKQVTDLVLLEQWYAAQSMQIWRDEKQWAENLFADVVNNVADLMSSLTDETKEAAEAVRELAQSLLQTFANTAIQQGVENIVQSLGNAAAGAATGGGGGSKAAGLAGQAGGAATGAGAAAVAAGASGPVGWGLLAAGLALSAVSGMFSNRDNKAREQEQYRAHLRALRQARQEEMLSVTIVLPDKPINPRDPEWQGVLLNTLLAAEGTRRIGSVTTKTRG